MQGAQRIPQPAKPADPMLGRTIAGRYRLEARIGEGGMGVVYRARHVLIDRIVAVKLIRPDLRGETHLRAWMLREARAANRVDHAHIIDIHDIGETGESELYLVMEYLVGTSLSSELARGSMQLTRGVDILEQMCAALARAHDLGVVHRDLKSDNILLTTRGGRKDFVKILDFGLAHLAMDPRLAPKGAVFGTPEYMAPEQARGEEAGPRADLYALGVVSYQLIAGRLPYEATSLTELALKQQQEEPATLDTLVADVSPELADAVAIALALDPRERYATARDMGDAISDAMRGIPPTDPSGGMRAAPATQATSLLASGPRGAGPRDSAGPRGTVTPRQPRPGPARQQAPVATPAARGSGAGRVWATLFAVLLLAVVVVAVIFIASPTSTTIKVHNVIYRDVSQSATALKELVAENTK
jgi:eukaryotic-like serine/threonine-protein kinase